MYCSGCGNKIDENEIFCPVCGLRIENEAEEKKVKEFIGKLLENEGKIKAYISKTFDILKKYEVSVASVFGKETKNFVEYLEEVCYSCEKLRYSACLLVDNAKKEMSYDKECTEDCLSKAEAGIKEIRECIEQVKKQSRDAFILLIETEKLYLEFCGFLSEKKESLLEAERGLSCRKHNEEMRAPLEAKCSAKKRGGIFKKLSSIFEKKEEKEKRSLLSEAQMAEEYRASEGREENNFRGYGLDFGTSSRASFNSVKDCDATFVLFEDSNKKTSDIDLGLAPVELSDVQFSAVVKKKAELSEYIPVNIIMYEDEFRKVVDEQLDEDFKEVKGGYHSIEKKAKVRVVLTSKDIELDDCSEEGIWQGKFLEFSFVAEVPENYHKKQIMFCASVYINDLIATKLKFIVDVKKDEEHNVGVERDDITSAFVSYASQDRDRVAAIIQGMKKARPDLDIFFDVETLRSGDKWEDALRTEIDKRKVLFLCWSKFASKSKWVDFEWRYALDKKGGESIDPIPIEPPELCPPPAELSDKHFNDRMIYVIKALEYMRREMAHLILKETNEKICVNKNSFIIGKLKDRVDFVAENPTVSRIHAEIICENNEYYIVDFNATNKTYVDGIVCTPEERIRLFDGAEIKLGNMEMVFKMPERV